MRNARTIGKLAREVGVETIRFYERRGLIAQPPKSQGLTVAAVPDRP